jgi:hypothetical protein
MSDFVEEKEKIVIPTHINIKKTRAVIDMIQAPVRKIISKKVITQTVVSGKFKTIVPASTVKEINHQIIDYKGVKYIVCYCPFKEDHILFVTNYESDKFYKDLVNKAWHYRSDGGYIASGMIAEDENKKELYLHNYAMDKLTFNGKGQHHTIDHINRIGRDNRKENLRELTQSHQNINQKKRDRIVNLPEDCDIDPNDIPKNIYYKAASGAHGEQFYIEIKTPEIVEILCKNDEDDLIQSRFRWFGTKIKTLDLRVKLQHAINKLEELKKTYPQIVHLLGDIDNIKERNELIQSFNDILDLTTYPKSVIESNKGTLIKEHNPIPVTQIQEQLIQEIEEKTIRGLKSNLPEGCGVTVQMVPKYCYYRPASETRSDKFIIERHPKLIAEGKRQWSTSEAKKLTTKQKFDLLLEKLKELE